MKNLCFGLATKIIIKQNSNFEKESNNERLKRIGEKIDLSLYDRKDYEDYTVLEIKKEIFEENAIKFIVEQYINMESKDRLSVMAELLRMNDSKYEKIMYYVKNNLINSLQFFDGDKTNNDISYLDSFRKSKISCDLICYLCRKNIVFDDGYNEMFNYIKKCIQNSSENEIRTAVVIALSDDKVKEE